MHGGGRALESKLWFGKGGRALTLTRGSGCWGWGASVWAVPGCRRRASGRACRVVGGSGREGNGIGGLDSWRAGAVVGLSRLVWGAGVWGAAGYAAAVCGVVGASLWVGVAVSVCRGVPGMAWVARF